MNEIAYVSFGRTFVGLTSSVATEPPLWLVLRGRGVPVALLDRAVPVPSDQFLVALIPKAHRSDVMCGSRVLPVLRHDQDPPRVVCFQSILTPC
jgi:hypothetical protein